MRCFCCKGWFNYLTDPHTDCRWKTFEDGCARDNYVHIRTISHWCGSYFTSCDEHLSLSQLADELKASGLPAASFVHREGDNINVVLFGAQPIFDAIQKYKTGYAGLTLIDFIKKLYE